MSVTVSSKGSSPLARGAPVARAVDNRPQGIIPACAGSTVCEPVPIWTDGDHPRLRGEHELKEGVVVSVKGSSPLARGARRPLAGAVRSVGIIPACAGSTPRSGSGRGRPWDHPRLRGEHFVCCQQKFGRQGSSPLARGARDRRRGLPRRRGIIPACAGSTPATRRRSACRGDHPRLRGEHSGLSLPLRPPQGSSPLARGARPNRGVNGLEVGIIPACAGSTANGSARSQLTWDHPRLRGEHQAAQWLRACLMGSSPLARGARSQVETATRR